MEAAAKSRDGRVVRGERTRQSLVEALLALLDEGELRPTAERIADRAGVSERSVFQHFPDREHLFEAVALQQYERVRPTLRPIDPGLPLPERLDAFLAQRTRYFEMVKGVRRAALLLEPDSPAVARWLQRTRSAKAAEVRKVFATEIGSAPEAERAAFAAALVAAAAWPAWESYRYHQGLGAARARAAMRLTMARLLGQG
jgi:TetR/AcrR family transcriptional regulator of autoinduction and epiphytic fitness